ncbi:MAG: alpha-amylase family glycosyl hydrolase [Myxococcota bacterium]
MVTHTRVSHFVWLPLLFATSCADPQSLVSPATADVAAVQGPDSLLEPAIPYPQDDLVQPEPEVDADDIGPDNSDDTDGGAQSEDTTAAPEPVDSDSEDTTSPEPTQWTVRSCTRALTYAPEAAVTSVHFATSPLGWADGALPMTLEDDGLYRLTLDMAQLPVGSHGYKLILDLGLPSESWIEDPSNMMRRFDDGFVNSKLRVPDCRAPRLSVIERTVIGGGQSALIRVNVESGIDSVLDLESLQVTHNFVPTSGEWDTDTGVLTLSLEALPPGKHTVRIDVSAEADGDTLAADPAVLSFWHEASPFEWRDASLYFAFTDRFRDADTASAPDPCLPADSIANWLGGDWAGVTEAIEEGYFQDLGINALWLNAPMDNPEGCVGGLYDRQYTAFHGYFPVDLFATEARYGSLQALRDLVSAAHAQGIRVLVDLPANHLFETALEWATHGWEWFNDDGVCRDLGWTTPETCWFEPYLPDLNYRNDTVVEYMSEVALKWAIDADLDGFRVDAVKHMHPHFLHTLRAKLDTRLEAHSDQQFWTVGETFTGSWQTGGGSEAEQVKAYISDDQLIGQFDFPLFWPIRGAFADRSAPLSWLAEAAEGSANFYGPDAIMSSFLGNHDVSRFITVAQGDNLSNCPGGSSVVAWDCPPPQPVGAIPYVRLLHAFTFLVAYPAVPLVYYGDEIGLAGAGDPDNRRLMPWDGLNPHQAALREDVSALFQARRNNVALRRGAFSIVSATDDTLVIERRTGESRAYAAFNFGTEPLNVSVPDAGSLPLTHVLEGTVLEPSEGLLSWTMPPETFGLWTTSP